MGYGEDDLLDTKEMGTDLKLPKAEIPKGHESGWEEGNSAFAISPVIGVTAKYSYFAFRLIQHHHLILYRLSPPHRLLHLRSSPPLPPRQHLKTLHLQQQTGDAYHFEEHGDAKMDDDASPEMTGAPGKDAKNVAADDR